MKKTLKKFFLVFLYIILINIILTLSTISLHELGHFILGSFYGCEKMKVILIDTDIASTFTPYTIMSCNQNISEKKLSLGAFLFTIPFGLLFFLLKLKPEKYFGLIIIGFNILISTLDVKKIIDLDILYYLEFIIGVLLIIRGEMLIVDYTLSKKKFKCYRG